MISLNYQEVKADIDFRMKNFDNLLSKNQNIKNEVSSLVIENELIITDIDVSEPILIENNDGYTSAIENPASVAEVNNEFNATTIEFVKREDEQVVDIIEEKLITEQTSAPKTKFELKEIDDPEYKPESFGIIGTIKSYLNLFGN